MPCCDTFPIWRCIIRRKHPLAHLTQKRPALTFCMLRIETAHYLIHQSPRPPPVIGQIRRETIRQRCMFLQCADFLQAGYAHAATTLLPIRIAMLVG